MDDDARTVLIAFGANVRRIRIEKGMTQDELAAEAGVGRAVPGKVENARKSLEIPTAARLARGLGVPLADLFDGIR